MKGFAQVLSEDVPEPFRRSYFEWVRHDVLRHVPSRVRSVLSVGCGSGATEAELVKRGVEVCGIELNPAAASAARARGMVVLQGDVAAITSELGDRSFDCILYADVLEHLADPLGVLALHVRRLRPGGVVIISIPNFRHYEVFWQLFVRGLVWYTDAGILDRTHLRITTRRMAVQWVESVGLNLARVQYGMSRRREKWLSIGSFGFLREFCARQVIIVAEKPRCHD